MENLTLINKDGIFYVDSREVAEMTGKRHDHLLRDIRGYEAILTAPNLGASEFFARSSYQDSKGETRQCYLLTKKGCDMVANKMTRAKGVLFTAAYVHKFHEMEAALQAQAPTNPFNLPQTHIEAVEAYLGQLKENARLLVVNAEQAEQIAIDAPKAKVYDAVLDSKGSILFTEAVKILGVRHRRFTQYLYDQGYIYKTSYAPGTDRPWLEKVSHQSKGLFNAVPVLAYTDREGVKHYKTQTQVNVSALLRLGHELLGAGLITSDDMDNTIEKIKNLK